MGLQVMSEEDRLRALQVGAAGMIASGCASACETMASMTLRMPCATDRAWSRRYILTKVAI